jgi:hypothetical protein
MAVELVNRNGVKVGRLPNAYIPAPAPVVQVATPKVAQPAEAVRPIRPEQSELGQIANSLAFFNENLRSLGSVYTRISNEENLAQGQQMALQDVEKAREITRLGFKKASEAGLIQAGANPYMRLGLYETTGQLQGQDYREKLLARKAELSSPFSTKTPEQVISEVRQEALTGLGDNFYAQQGFLKEANQAEQTFKNVVIQEKARFTEIQTKETDAVATTKIIGALATAQTPEETEASLGAVISHYNKRSVYESDVNKEMGKDIYNGIISVALKDPEKAKEIANKVFDLQIARRDGSLMSLSEAFAGIEDNVTEKLDQLEYKRKIAGENEEKMLEREAEKEIDLEIKNAQDQNASIISPEFAEAVKERVSKKFGGVQLAFISDQIAKQTASVNRSDEALASEYVLELAKTDPAKALETLKEATGTNISFETALVLQSKIAKTNDNLQLIRSESVRDNFKDLEDSLKKNESFLGVYEKEDQIKDALVDVEARHKSNVVRFLRTLPANMPQAEVEIELSKAMPQIYKDTQKEILDDLKSKTLTKQPSLEGVKTNTRGTGATDPAVKVVSDGIFAELNPWYSARNPLAFGAIQDSQDKTEARKIFSRLDRVAQIQNREVFGTSNPTQVANFKPDAEKRELQELQGWLNNKGRTYLTTLGKYIKAGGADTDFGFRPFTKEVKEKYQADYMEAKKRLGFSLLEVVNGKTTDGVEFDPKTLSIDDTLFFPNMETLRKATNEYKQRLDSGQPRGTELLYQDVINDLYNFKTEQEVEQFQLNQAMKAKQIFGK